MRIADRFEQVHFESDQEQLEPDDQMAELSKKVKTEYFVDQSGSIVEANPLETRTCRICRPPLRPS